MRVQRYKRKIMEKLKKKDKELKLEYFYILLLLSGRKNGDIIICFAIHTNK